MANVIRMIGDNEWKKSSNARRAHWLRNQIAFHKAHGLASDADWIRRCEKRLAQVEKRMAAVTA